MLFYIRKAICLLILFFGATSLFSMEKHLENLSSKSYTHDSFSSETFASPKRLAPLVHSTVLMPEITSLSSVKPMPERSPEEHGYAQQAQGVLQSSQFPLAVECSEYKGPLEEPINSMVDSDITYFFFKTATKGKADRFKKEATPNQPFLQPIQLCVPAALPRQELPACSVAPDEPRTTPVIETIVAEHERLSFANEQIESTIILNAQFPQSGLFGTITNSLMQQSTKSLRGVSGYYALYNALCFLEPLSYNRLCRKSFTHSLRKFLFAIKGLRGSRHTLGKLTALELRQLIGHLKKDIVVFDIENLFAKQVAQSDPLATLCDYDELSMRLMMDFKSCKRDNLVVIASTRSKSHHWVTFLLKRKDGKIHFHICDSVCRPETLGEEAILYRFYPIYLAAITPVGLWPKVFTEQYCQERNVFLRYTTKQQDATQFIPEQNEISPGLRTALEDLSEPTYMQPIISLLPKISKEELFTAAKNNQGHKIRQMLLQSNKPDINATNDEGLTALHIAVISRSLFALNALLEPRSIEVNINQADHRGLTPLHYAVEIDYEAAVRTLLLHHALPDVRKRSQRSWLVRCDLAIDTRPQEEIDDDDERTPLHIAARDGNIKIIELLLENEHRRASINMRNYFGATALFEAVKAGHGEVVKKLLSKNAKCNFYVNKKRGWLTRTGEFAIHGYNAMGPCLIQQIGTLTRINGYDKDNYVDYWFLYRAVRRMDVCQPIVRGETVLHSACLLGNVEIVQALVDHNASIDEKDDNGATPLFLAAQNGFTEIVQILIAHRANVNHIVTPLQIFHHTTIPQSTSLIEACSNGHLATVQLLINNGADVHFDHDSALRAAIANDRRQIVSLLVTYGGFFSLFNQQLQTLPACAAADGQCLQSLFEHDIAAHSQDTQAAMPALNKDKIGHLAVLKKLLVHGNETLPEASSAIPRPASTNNVSVQPPQVRQVAAQEPAGFNECQDLPAASAASSVNATRARANSATFQRPLVQPTNLEFQRKTVEIIIYSDSKAFETNLCRYLHSPYIGKKLSKALNVEYLFKDVGVSALPKVHRISNIAELTVLIKRAESRIGKMNELEYVVFASGAYATYRLLDNAHKMMSSPLINSVILFNPSLPASGIYTPTYGVVRNRVYNFWSMYNYGRRRKIFPAPNNQGPAVGFDGQAYFKGVNIYTQVLDDTGNTVETFNFNGITEIQFHKIIKTIRKSHQYHLQTNLCSIIDNATNSLPRNSECKPLLKAKGKLLPIVFLQQKLNIVKHDGEVKAPINLAWKLNEIFSYKLPANGPHEDILQLEALWSDSLRQDLAIDTATTSDFKLVADNPYSREKMGDAAIDQVRTEVEIYRLEKEYIEKRKAVVVPALGHLCGRPIRRPINVAIVASGGGSRATYATYGVLKGLQAIGVLGTVSYIDTLSGSTWAASGLYTQVNKKGKTDICDALNGAIKRSFKYTSDFSFVKEIIGKTIACAPTRTCGIGDPTVIKVKKELHQPVTNTDYYGCAIGRCVMGQGGDIYCHNYKPQYLSQQLGESAAWRQKNMSLPESYVAHLPFPVYTAIMHRDDPEKIRLPWFEFTPYEIGTILGKGNDRAGMFVKTWAFGRKFKEGTSTDYDPEQSLEFYLGVCGSAMNSTVEDAIAMISPAFAENAPLPMRKHRLGCAEVLNPMLGMKNPQFTEYAQKEKIGLADGGTANNLPYAARNDCDGFRSERKPDVVIFIDSSADVKPGNVNDPEGQAWPSGVALKGVEAYAKEYGIDFPELPAQEALVKATCSIFNNQPSANLQQPVVVYLPILKKCQELNGGALVNHIIEQYDFTGVSPKIPFASIDLGKYGTAHTGVDKQEAVDLMTIMHSNVYNNQRAIIEAICERTMAMQ